MLRSVRFALLSSLICASFACTNTVTTTGGPGGSGGGGSGGTGGTGGSSSTGNPTTSSSSTGTGGVEPGATTLTAQMGPLSIESGGEAVKCVVVALDNAESVFVRKFRTNLNEGSHHMIVYTTDQPANDKPYPCQSFSVAGGSAIFIAQQPHSELVFPKDADGTPVGLELAPHQALTLEMHYINTTAATLDVIGKVEMDVLPITSKVVKSGFSFLGDLGIPVIPANGEADTGVHFQNAVPGSKVFALTTHQHKLGTRMQVWYASDKNDLSQSIADSTSWADPPLELFDPPLDFPADGSKGFAYDCHWKNPTPKDVYGGLSAEDEMCFFWNYFYPVP